MLEDYTNGYQVLSDGRVVWVNGPDGAAVARLARCVGTISIDVHQPLSKQRETGGECLDCRQDLKGEEAWLYFTRSVKVHFGVNIAQKHRPRWASRKKEQ